MYTYRCNIYNFEAVVCTLRRDCVTSNSVFFNTGREFVYIYIYSSEETGCNAMSGKQRLTGLDFKFLLC